MRRLAVLVALASCHRAKPRAPVPDDVAMGPVELVVQLGHTGGVSRTRFSDDGQLVATCAVDSVKLWSTPTGKLLRTLPGTSACIDVRFLDEGTRILAIGRDGGARVWDTATGAQRSELAPFPDAPRSLTTVAVDAGATLAVFGASDGTAWVRDLSTGAIRGLALEGDADPGATEAVDSTASIIQLAVSPDGRLAATLAIQREDYLGSTHARIWRISDGETVYHDSVWNEPEGTIAFSSDGSQVAWTTGYTTTVVETATGAVSAKRSTEVPVWAIVALEQPRTFLIDAGGGDLSRLSDGAVVEVTSLDSELVWSASSDGSRIVTSSLAGGGALTIRRIDGSLISTINRSSDPLFYASIAAAAGQALISSESGVVSWWDLETAKLRSATPTDRDDVFAVLLPGGDRAYVDSELWDLRTGAVLGSDDGPEATEVPGWTSADGRILLDETSGWDLLEAARGVDLHEARTDEIPNGQLEVKDAATGELIRVIPVPMQALSARAISPDGKQAALAGNHERFYLVDVDHGDLRGPLGPGRVFVHDLVFSPDSTMLATAGDDGIIRLWDVAAGTERRAFRGHGGPVVAVAFRPDGFLISAGTDATIRIWNPATDDVLTLASSGPEWIAFSQDGFFDASRKGAELVAMVQGTQVFGIEQFAVRNNRPDILFERFGLGDPATVEHFRLQAERRMRRAGLTLTDLRAELHVPEAQILAAAPDGKHVKLTIELRDDRRELVRYQVYANGVPAVTGDASGHAATITATIELVAGINKLEVSAWNDEGAESYRAMTAVRHTAAAKGSLYFLGFGVSKHRDARLDLGYAHKDATDLHRLFGKLRGYADLHAHLFTDDEVTVAALREARALLANATADDTVVVFIAGHGVHDDDADETYYFVTHETEPARLASTAAPFSLIEALVAETAARRKLLLLDTCESGDAEDAAAPAATRLTARSARAVLRRDRRRPRRHLWDRDRYVYNDVERRTGAIVLSSSRGGELSYEDPAFENGLFSEAVIDALTTDEADLDGDGRIAATELEAYVGQRVGEMSGGLQHPVVDRDNPDQQLDFPLSP